MVGPEQFMPGVYSVSDRPIYGVQPGDILSFRGYPDGAGNGELARVYEIRVEYRETDIGFKVQVRPNVTVRVQWLNDWGQPREEYSLEWFTFADKREIAEADRITKEADTMLRLSQMGRPSVIEAEKPDEGVPQAVLKRDGPILGEPVGIPTPEPQKQLPCLEALVESLEKLNATMDEQLRMIRELEKRIDMFSK